jgi:spore coat protein JB
MNQIQQYSFYVTDIALYLDTHPNDLNAIRVHNEYARKLKNAEDLYQMNFGPLSIYYPVNKWYWINNPMPWEKGANV